MRLTNKILNNVDRGTVPTVAAQFSISRGTLYRKLKKGELTHPAVKHLVALAKKKQQEREQMQSEIDSL